MGTKFNLNGNEVISESDRSQTLLRVLRDEFYLTGTKEGCGTGDCGACMVLVDGQAVNSCLMLLGEIENKKVVTIEGLEQNGELDPIQKAFAEKGALQCGYCTPGMIIAIKGLFIKNPNPTREEIAEAISGNLCRCTGYEQIIEATQYAVQLRDEKNEL
ncbi:MAG: (2Fe-2S)-binding protein [Saccharofermentanales bacterium]|jgi:carbon-monoxide dehydrogenase small subunit